MKKYFAKFISLIPTKRRLIQLYAALLFNANFKGFANGSIYSGGAKKLCVPGLNCYSCPGAVGACPLGSLQGSFSADKSTLFYVGGILLLYSLLFGRMICGWLCPFGLIQELLYKIRTPKLKKGRITRALSYLKYAVLVYFVFVVPIWYALENSPFPAFCKYICPAGTLEGGIGLLSNPTNEGYFEMLGPLFTWKFIVLICVAVGCIFVYRGFCRFICPLGALYGLFNKISLFGVKVEAPKCTNCGNCVKTCKMDIKRVGDCECISCGDCVKKCPAKAIVWKGPKIFTDRNEELGIEPKDKKTARNVTRSVVAVVLAALLIGSTVYYNVDEAPEADESSQGEISGETVKGNKVGDLCFGADLQIIEADGIKTETVDPTKMGKITVINFWGTWCSGCIEELPYFDRIASEFKDTVTVVAVHTDMIKDTAPAYIADKYPESEMIFACDLENEQYYSMLGGRDSYPYTVVIDAEGIVRRVFLKALKYEELLSVIEEISKD